jgi:hypothetical protein
MHIIHSLILIVFLATITVAATEVVSASEIKMEQVGHIDGEITTIDVSGNYIYAGQGARPFDIGDNWFFVTHSSG